ncbi:MAG: fluoride efflux transporter CrcB [Bdellovibrionales bacterium]|nr:fluoride efflux transporter CrcB [Bdellovibrionales bacterium]
MKDIFIVGLGGFLGATSRHLVYLWFGARNWTSFPWATLFINILGCFLIGALSLWIEKSLPYHRTVFLLASVGFLGAFTTFSAFGLETFNLLKQQQVPWALMNIIASITLGLVAVVLGRWTALQIS